MLNFYLKRISHFFLSNTYFGKSINVWSRTSFQRKTQVDNNVSQVKSNNPKVKSSHPQVAYPLSNLIQSYPIWSHLKLSDPIWFQANFWGKSQQQQLSGFKDRSVEPSQSKILVRLFFNFSRETDHNIYFKSWSPTAQQTLVCRSIQIEE